MQAENLTNTGGGGFIHSLYLQQSNLRTWKDTAWWLFLISTAKVLPADKVRDSLHISHKRCRWVYPSSTGPLVKASWDLRNTNTDNVCFSNICYNIYKYMFILRKTDIDFTSILGLEIFKCSHGYVYRAVRLWECPRIASLSLPKRDKIISD